MLLELRAHDPRSPETFLTLNGAMKGGSLKRVQKEADGKGDLVSKSHLAPERKWKKSERVAQLLMAFPQGPSCDPALEFWDLPCMPSYTSSPLLTPPSFLNEASSSESHYLQWKITMPKIRYWIFVCLCFLRGQPVATTGPRSNVMRSTVEITPFSMHACDSAVFFSRVSAKSW